MNTPSKQRAAGRFSSTLIPRSSRCLTFARKASHPNDTENATRRPSQATQSRRSSVSTTGKGAHFVRMAAELSRAINFLDTGFQDGEKQIARSFLGGSSAIEDAGSITKPDTRVTSLSRPLPIHLHYVKDSEDEEMGLRPPAGILSRTSVEKSKAAPDLIEEGLIKLHRINNRVAARRVESTQPPLPRQYGDKLVFTKTACFIRPLPIYDYRSVQDESRERALVRIQNRAARPNVQAWKSMHTKTPNESLLQVLKAIDDELQAENEGSGNGRGGKDRKARTATDPVEGLPQSPLTDRQLVAARSRFQTIKPKQPATTTLFHDAMAANPFGKNWCSNAQHGNF